MSNYLNVNDILVTNEKVPCTFLTTLPRLGFMVASSATDDVEAGSNAELPLWLAEALSARRGTPLVSVGLPRVYREAYREILQADACAVDLHKLGQYFYELGCCVSKYDIKGEVASTLVSTFRQRYRLVAETSSRDADSSSATSGDAALRMCASERRRSAEAGRTARELAGWLRSGESLLQTAEMVASHRKRKRDQMELL